MYVHFISFIDKYLKLNLGFLCVENSRDTMTQNTTVSEVTTQPAAPNHCYKGVFLTVVAVVSGDTWGEMCSLWDSFRQTCYNAIR